MFRSSPELENSIKLNSLFLSFVQSKKFSLHTSFKQLTNFPQQSYVYGECVYQICTTFQLSTPDPVNWHVRNGIANATMHVSDMYFKTFLMCEFEQRFSDGLKVKCHLCSLMLIFNCINNQTLLSSLHQEFHKLIRVISFSFFHAFATTEIIISIHNVNFYHVEHRTQALFYIYGSIWRLRTP